MTSVINFLTSAWDWILHFWGHLQEMLLWIPHKMFSDLLQGLVTAFNAIPVPDFLGQIGGLFGAIPSGVWWFASVGEFKAGVAMVVSAYTIRFLIRRLPVIG